MRIAFALCVLLSGGAAAEAQDRYDRGYRSRDRVMIRPHGADVYRRYDPRPRPWRAPLHYYWGHRTYARPYLGPHPYRYPRYGRPWGHYQPYRPYYYRPHGPFPPGHYPPAPGYR